MRLATKISIGICALSCVGNLYAAKPKAQDFAGADGYLDDVEIAYYVISLHEIPISKLLKPGQTQLNPSEIAQMDFVLDYIEELRIKSKGFLKELPWRYQDIDNPPQPGGKSQQPEPGKNEIHESNIIRQSHGPLKLRKNKDELAKSELSKAKGASISFFSDHNSNDAETVSSEGVLYYPFKIASGTGPATSSLLIGPAVDWKLTNTDDGKTGVQDITFSAATTYYREPESDRSALWNISGSPYFQTDLAGGHEIYGAEASVEFVGWLTSRSKDVLFLGDYTPLGILGLDYQLRIIPQIDYSITEQTGKFSKRGADDDWLRAGARSSFDLRLPAYRVEIGAAFAFLDAIDGKGGYSDKYTLRASWSINENVALTLEKTKGETPVSDKEIDTTTLGLEAKF